MLHIEEAKQGAPAPCPMNRIKSEKPQIHKSTLGV